MFLTQKIKRPAKEGGEARHAEAKLGGGFLGARAGCGAGAGGGSEPQLVPRGMQSEGIFGRGGCQNWGDARIGGGRGGSTEGRASVSAEILLGAPPPAPEAGWCPPSLHPSLSQDAPAAFFFKPHLCRRLSRHHHPPTTAWKQDGAKVSLQTWSCPGSPDKRDFPVFIVQDAETYSCSIFFPSCLCTLWGGGLLPQGRYQQLLASTPFPAAWRAPGDLPACDVE